MGDLQVIGGIKKLNNQNYNTWSTCMMSYMQGQDLREVVNGCEITQPEAEDANGALRKWKIKAGKAMFALNTTIEEDVLEHIRDAKIPHEAWKTFADLFSKKNDTKLQLLESELLSIAQRELTVAQFFHKVKTLYREISELDAEAPIGETRMKRIIIHGLRPDFRSFVAAVQGWQTQPSLVEFENLLAGQEALAKQMGEVPFKDKAKINRGGRNSSEARGYRIKRKFEGKCYNYGKKGHMAKDCWQKKEHVEGNAATFKLEDEWDAHAFFTAVEEAECLQRKEHVKSNAVTLQFEDEWDAHAFFTEVTEKLRNLVEYKGKHVVVAANNSKLAIAHKNLQSVAQLTSSGHFVLFGPQDVKVYHDLESLDEPVIKGQRLESVYVISVQTAYVDKTRKSETVDLWHQRLSHVSFSKLNMMMRRSTLKGLPQLERLDFQSPFEKLWNKKPTVSYFRVFGCVCYVFIPNHLRSKMDKKAVRCIFVGYDNQRKGWKCCDPITGKCYTSRNVVFDESSSWWSIEQKSLPDSEGFKEEMQIARIQLSNDEDNTDSQEEVIDDDAEIKENPWQTGIHDQLNEEFNAATTSTPPRRSTRMKKPNAKYANAAVVEGSLLSEVPI
ncbi:hypothetical protein SADUNF_Sadunf07G0099100 [Salix dunnii]|uniref:CCHC-type domain-containing protein n=1 Tax=Salix dunnii TaxID=1413687 RepID=A0A835JZY3_9ROSI|nr:hypothetical protein SADUNF_Sadunf07G0099100 [Salix dunnii]